MTERRLEPPIPPSSVPGSPPPPSGAVRRPHRVSTYQQPALGFIDPALVRRAFAVLIVTIAWLLIALSVFGTFYGARGMDAPLTTPILLFFDIMSAPSAALVALLAQAVLSLAQWGARQFAAHDRRWWILYVASLSLSAWWNWSAYGDPLISIGVPWLLSIGLVVLGDVFPELILVRERN